MAGSDDGGDDSDGADDPGGEAGLRESDDAGARVSRDGDSADRPGVLPDSRLERAVTLVLLGALLVAVAGVVYVSVTPTETADPYTEFYVLGPEGNASGYPTNLTVGETGEFVVGITNHEHEPMRYAVVARLGDRELTSRSVRVTDEQTWEDTLSFTAREPGEHRLRILLYKRATPEGDPDDFLRLWVRVGNASS